MTNATCAAYSRAVRTIALLLAASLAVPAFAGGGPESVVVVVNADRWASLTAANEFVALRHIPPANVVYLSHVPDLERTDVEAFRERLLKPVLQTIRDRGVGAPRRCHWCPTGCGREGRLEQLRWEPVEEHQPAQTVRLSLPRASGASRKFLLGNGPRSRVSPLTRCACGPDQRTDRATRPRCDL